MNETNLPVASKPDRIRWSKVVIRGLCAGALMGILIGISSGLARTFTHLWWLQHLGKICAVVVLMAAIRGIIKKP